MRVFRMTGLPFFPNLLRFFPGTSKRRERESEANQREQPKQPPLSLISGDISSSRLCFDGRNQSSNEKENSEEESEHKGAANVKVEENDGIGLCGVISSTRSSPGVLLRGS
ncbi:uncharacterized protein LOC131311106 isoform X2 [Rhododendron vialii]|uniref:uncharacterized protein LOC131311106 isoform X2 n=1 Tax=Rhododendron vialii TaxID=182163 RepID=UPI00265E9A25|nr:uncharacterized protein LOC131311106 isoform X2 [Rhododendron vialii]